ncbi:MAG TPA: hypothetical protein VHL77_04240, partial [Ferruginibacter sp.]|nr:hypothetical protein [Ferruginibacter sp.]
AKKAIAIATSTSATSRAAYPETGFRIFSIKQFDIILISNLYQVFPDSKFFWTSGKWNHPVGCP